MPDKSIRQPPDLRILLPIPCPLCARQETQRLDYPSKMSHANIYQCGGCGHIWALPLAPPRLKRPPPGFNNYRVPFALGTR